MIEYYRIEDGKEILSGFAHGNQYYNEDKNFHGSLDGNMARDNYGNIDYIIVDGQIYYYETYKELVDYGDPITPDDLDHFDNPGYISEGKIYMYHETILVQNDKPVIKNGIVFFERKYTEIYELIRETGQVFKYIDIKPNEKELIGILKGDLSSFTDLEFFGLLYSQELFV